MERKKTKAIKIRNIFIGGDNPIAIQSMTKVPTTDIKAILDQIKALENEGCQIIRLAIPNKEAAEALKEIRKNTDMPLVADIHFDYKLALMAIEAGIDKLRINPGNIGEAWKVKEVVKAAKDKGIPIRIGVNAGSLEKDILERYGYPTAEAMVESAIKHISILEDNYFDDIVISLKAADIDRTVKAYRIISEKYNYPLHLGITEAGTLFSGTIKSVIGIGILLYEGIGDTIRISLAADPIEEVKAAKELLKALHLRTVEPTVIVCPSCGRCEIDLQSIAKTIEDKVKDLKKPIQIAIMGCVVNGPGEAKEADIGITGGKNVGIIFKKGKLYKKVEEKYLVDALLKEIEEL